MTLKLVALLSLVLVAVLLSGIRPTNATNTTPLTEVLKLLASNGQAGDLFARRVAISGDVAIVGAPLNDTGGELAGVAYIFQRSGGGSGSWGEVVRLTASDAQTADTFGYSVAVSGNIVVVGAPRDSEGGELAGAAYIFQRNQGGTDNWGEVTKLIASDPEPDDGFGWSVAVDENTTIVGAWKEDAGGNNAGAAYVFQRDYADVGNWGEVKKLSAADAQANDSFGQSVAISGDTAIAGASREDSGALNGGAAYVFRRDEGGVDGWGEVRKLISSDIEASDAFGGSVAISGDTAVVGASFRSSGATDNGAAYVFQRNEGGANNWGQLTKLIASDTQTDDHLGIAAISGDTIVVGASGEDSAGIVAGAAYVFLRNQGGANHWGEVAKLAASDAEAGDLFGSSVAVSSETVLVGAKGEDASGRDAGAAYVFDLPFPRPALSEAEGDVNCDGSTSSIDAVLILQFAAELLTSLPCDDGDIDKSGATDALDAALVLQSAAGLAELPL